MTTNESADSYFESVEEAFIRLRGAPLLLSPEDWQIARRWQREGVPLDLVLRTLEAVFSQRRQRGGRGRVNSLKYCRDAVERAWDGYRELQATGHRADAAPLEVGSRLRALADALPADLPDRQAWAGRLVALEGEAEEVEAALEQLDAELLRHAESALEEAALAELERRVDTRLERVAARVTAEEAAETRAVLRRQALRAQLELPLLSLFSPQAQPADPGSTS